MEDAQIVDLYWQRSSDAIPVTAERYGNYCAAVARNILADDRDAEECVNDTWLRAWNRMPSERPRLLSAFSRPRTAFIVVVLPAPFLPMKPKTLCSGTVRSSPRSTSLFPNRLPGSEPPCPA